MAITNFQRWIEEEDIDKVPVNLEALRAKYRNADHQLQYRNPNAHKAAAPYSGGIITAPRGRLEIRCSTCINWATLVYATNKGLLPRKILTDFDDHVRAVNTALELEEPPPPRLMGLIRRPRSSVEYWVYHINDDLKPNKTTMWNSQHLGIRLQDLRQSAHEAIATNNVLLSSFFTRPFILVEIGKNQSGSVARSRLLRLDRTAEGHVPQVQRWITSAKNRGYEATMIDILPVGVTAPPSSLDTYIKGLVATYANTKSVASMIEGIKELEQAVTALSITEQLLADLKKRLQTL